MRLSDVIKFIRKFIRLNFGLTDFIGQDIVAGVDVRVIKGYLVLWHSWVAHWVWESGWHLLQGLVSDSHGVAFLVVLSEENGHGGLVVLCVVCLFFLKLILFTHKLMFGWHGGLVSSRVIKVKLVDLDLICLEVSVRSCVRDGSGGLPAVLSLCLALASLLSTLSAFG